MRKETCETRHMKVRCSVPNILAMQVGPQQFTPWPMEWKRSLPFVYGFWSGFRRSWRSQWLREKTYDREVLGGGVYSSFPPSH